MMMMMITFSLGTDRFSRDVEAMIGHPISNWWLICWKYLSPLMVLVSSFVLNLVPVETRVNTICLLLGLRARAPPTNPCLRGDRLRDDSPLNELTHCRLGNKHQLTDCVGFVANRC